MFNREDYWDTTEAGKLCGVSPETVRRWIRRKYIASDSVEVHGGTYYVHKEGFEQWRKKLGEGKALKGRKIPVMTVSLLRFVL